MEQTTYTCGAMIIEFGGRSSKKCAKHMNGCWVQKMGLKYARSALVSLTTGGTLLYQMWPYKVRYRNVPTRENTPRFVSNWKDNSRDIQISGGRCLCGQSNGLLGTRAMIRIEVYITFNNLYYKVASD